MFVWPLVTTQAYCLPMQDSRRLPQSPADLLTMTIALSSCKDAGEKLGAAAAARPLTESSLKARSLAAGSLRSIHCFYFVCICWE